MKITTVAEATTHNKHRSWSVFQVRKSHWRREKQTACDAYKRTEFRADLEPQAGELISAINSNIRISRYQTISVRARYYAK